MVNNSLVYACDRMASRDCHPAVGVLNENGLA
jgi:hypothetical protein